MKTIKLLLLTAILVCSNMIFANNPVNPETKKTNETSISKEIVKLLSNNYFLVEKETVAKVVFTINNENEIVVLSVDSGSEEVEDFIKGKLNYYKVTFKEVKPGKKYLLPVRFFMIN
ncbi:hypothetical protein [Thalassobellus citreus]|uniref:hypothetical protein n=1 Tax=Thalassobellus citreus TaxID=3367752 RepID=UPI0037A9857F